MAHPPGRTLPLGGLKLGTSQFRPADEDELLSIASGLDTEVLKPVHLQTWDAFASELVRASRAAALLRLREEAGLPADEEAFRTRHASASKAADECHPALRDEAIRLLNRVEGEPPGSGQTLAEECHRSVTHAEQSDDVAALAALKIAAQSFDLFDP